MVQDLIEEGKATSFVDIEFPPTMQSIYNTDEQYPFEEEIVWKRAKDFLQAADRSMPPILSDSVKPTDVTEGKLGNGYFASALACLAEKPELIEKLLVTEEYAQDGLYKV